VVGLALVIAVSAPAQVGGGRFANAGGRLRCARFTGAESFTRVVATWDVSLS
jgi:hypothetical protein